MVRSYQSDAFKREYGRSTIINFEFFVKCMLSAKDQPDKQREIPGVKHLDVRDSSVGNDGYLASKNVE